MKNAIGLLLLAGLILILGVQLNAQVITGTVLGKVHDQSGSVVPNAKITVRNQDTNVKTESASNGVGEYTIPFLPAGAYEITVEMVGMRTFRQSNVAVQVDFKTRVDVAMQLGEVRNVIEISAQQQVLQTDSTDVSFSISNRLVENLPNVGRNPLAYVNLVPGVVTRGNLQPTTVAVGDDSRRQFTQFSLNGARPVSTEVLLDGAPDTNPSWNEASVIPALDAITEPRIITSNYSAEYGRVIGGVVSFSTKSGSNGFHGSLGEVNQNRVFNANTFGNNSYGSDANGTPLRPRGPFNMNRFGGTFGGPVTIPQLYNGKNKTFFFVSYEGIRMVQSANAFFTVPTAAERTGDFSQTRVLKNINGQAIQVPLDIYAPFTATTQVNTLGPGSYQLIRPQVQDGAVLNKIPASMLNKTGLALANLYPLPNVTAQPDGSNNYFLADANRTRADQLMVRLDQNFSQSHRTFFRYTTDWSYYKAADIFDKSAPEARLNPPMSQFNPTATLGHTWMISATRLLDLRANATRINFTALPPQFSNLSALGFSPAMIAAAQYMVVPRTAAFPNGSSSIAAFGAAGNALRDNHFTNSSVTGSFTNIRNKWTLKVGGEYRAYLSNTFQSGTQSFAFAQAGALTTRCGGANCPQIPNSQAQGSGFAAMLMGAMEASGGGGQFQDGDPRVALKAGYMGLYTQNDWKATDRLTVNLGFRWEYQAPLTERYNRMAQFDPNAINTTGTMGTLTYSGVGGNGRGMTDSDHRNFAPRVGLAYRLDDKTVIRSAYGITYDMTTGIGQGSAGFGTTGFSAPSIMLIRPTTGPYVNQDMLDRPYNDPVVIGPTAVGPNASDPRNYLFGSLLQTVRKQLTPYVQQWNFTIERDLPGGINLSLSYVGSKGTRLPTQINRANEDYEVSPSILASAQQQYAINGTNPLLTMVANPFYGTIPSTVPNGAPTISRLQLSRPYPAYNTIWIMHWRLGTSSYESGQLTVRKHFHNGMEVGGNYVWSKNMSYGGGISAGVDTNMGGNYNNFGSVNRELETSVDGGDVPHRAVIYYSLDLPFGKGKPLLPATPVLSQLLGGWKVSGQTTFSSGVPLNVFRAFPARPDLVGDPVLSAQYRCQGPATCSLPDGTTVNVPAHRMLYFNPHAFSNRMVQIQSNGSYRDQIYWFGNAPRFLSNLRSAGINNWNMSLSREIKLSERARLEIRADATNAFNHTQWSPQGGTYGNNMGASNSQAGSSLGYGTDTTFGTVNTNNTALPRYMQIQARFVF